MSVRKFVWILVAIFFSVELLVAAILAWNGVLW